jgi:alkylhydroperoxidase domain protein
MSTLTTPAEVATPPRFTSDTLGWVPWVEPLAEDELTERHYEGLVQRPRAKNPYFRLLARDPEVLGARTKTDLDIFYNTGGGLGRAERELGATVASRSNGCVYCASVHSAFATHFSKRGDDVQRLLEDGVTTDLGDDVWNAVRDAVVALTATPVRFGLEHVAALRAAGLDDAAVLDVINSGSFFNWANRLMLSLGEPTLS